MSEKRFTIESTSGEQLNTFDYTERLCDLLNELAEQLNTFDYTERLCVLLNEVTTKCSRLEEDLKYGLGEAKSYYCKGDYIWLDENENITSKSRQDGGQ